MSNNKNWCLHKNYRKNLTDYSHHWCQLKIKWVPRLNHGEPLWQHPGRKISTYTVYIPQYVPCTFQVHTWHQVHNWCLMGTLNVSGVCTYLTVIWITTLKHLVIKLKIITNLQLWLCKNLESSQNSSSVLNSPTSCDPFQHWMMVLLWSISKL